MKTNFILKLAIWQFIAIVYFLVCWVVNAIQFFKCDFAAPYKDELIHFIGIVIPLLSSITVYF